jgi:hypothetical protein
MAGPRPGSSANARHCIVPDQSKRLSNDVVADCNARARNDASGGRFHAGQLLYGMLS